MKKEIWGDQNWIKTYWCCGNHRLSNQPFIVTVVGRAGKIPYDRLCSVSLLLYLQRFHPSIMLKYFHHAETFPSCWNISIMLIYFYHAKIFPSTCNILPLCTKCMYQTQSMTYTDAVPDVPKSAMTSIEALPNVTDSFMTYIEDLPNVTDSFMTYIEAVPELETGINTGLCYRRDQAACVPWVASIFALCIVSLLHG